MITYWYLSEEEKVHWEKYDLKTRLGLSDSIHIVREHPLVGWHRNIVLVPVIQNHKELFADKNNNFFTRLTTKQKYWLRTNPEAVIAFIDGLEVKPIVEEYSDNITKGILKIKEEFKIRNRFIFFNNDIHGTIVDKELKIEKAGGLLYPQFTYKKELTEKEIKEHFLEFTTVPTFTKKIVSMNGRFRPSRSILVDKIRKHTPKEDLYLSYHGLADDWSFEQAESILQGTYPQHNTPELMSLLSKTPYSTYDKEKITNLYKGSNKQIFIPEPEIYNDIFIDIMTETLCERENDWRESCREGQFITEKTTKPIIALKPFMILASRGYLEYLRDLGFKTFDNWINELYDRADYDDAINIIEDNIKYINSLSIDQLYTMYKEMEPTLLHNRKRLFNLLYKEENRFSKIIENIT